MYKNIFKNKQVNLCPLTNKHAVIIAIKRVIKNKNEQ